MPSCARCSVSPASTSSRATNGSPSSTHRCRVEGKTRKMTSTNFRGMRMHAAGLLVAAVLLPFCGTTVRAQEVQITIDNFTFSPPELTVKVGDTVTWTNHDDIPHTIVSAGKFRSKTLDTDNTYSFTFASAGDYK